ncbi:MAG: nuclear transport factor 2 family protein [Betaproteobacteria bacterium]|nr:nuclear transport factor 2 family protein [Betaproteobacteria bacterium]
MNAQALARVVDYWQTLTPQSVEAIATIYSEGAYFRDPFNEVRGLPAIQKIFADMFVRLIEPRFTIIETIAEGDNATLIWDFEFRIRGFQPDRLRRIHGLTHLRFAPDGRVDYHRDYWDAAGELYEIFPLIGAVLRWLKKRAA